MRPSASRSISTHRARAATVAQWSRTSSHRPMPDSLPVLRSERLTLRPIADADLDALTEIVIASEWWGTPGDRDDLLQDGRAFVIEVEGEVAGWLGFDEERDPEYMFASLDIM